MQDWNGHTLIIALLLGLSSNAIGQRTWRELHPPVTRDLRRLAFLDSARGWVSGLDGTILRTTNAGRTWQAQQSGVTEQVHEIFFVNDRLGWALAWTDYADTVIWFGTNMLKTTNGGVLWTRSQYPVTGEFFSAIHFHDSLNGVMAGAFGRIVRTTDGGATWALAQVDSSPYAQWGIRRFRFFSRTYGYAMGGRLDIVGVVWKTTNGGQRWTADGVSPEPVRDLCFLDSLNIVGVAGDLDFGASMVSTKNAGVLWEYQFLQIFGEPSAVSFRTSAEAWSPLGFAGFFMTTSDTGRRWSLVETPRRRPIYDVTFTDSLTGYAVGDSGMVLKFDGTTSVAQPAISSQPGPMQLRQNYPNPFNPATTIEFELPASEVVSLRLFNLLGEELKAIVTNQRFSAGVHRVHVDASDLGRRTEGGPPSGVYFYQLSSSRFRSVKKMMIVR